jgi:hypothetical protein
MPSRHQGHRRSGLRAERCRARAPLARTAELTCDEAKRQLAREGAVATHLGPRQPAPLSMSSVSSSRGALRGGSVGTASASRAAAT